jgi:hypothetical protein
VNILKLLVFLSMPFTVCAMEPHTLDFTSPEMLLKNAVRKYIQKKEQAYRKESFYSRPDESLAGNIVVLANPFIDKEVDSGAWSIVGTRGALCADNKIFIMDMIHSDLRIIPLASRVEVVDHTLPAISALCYCPKFFGIKEDCVIMGENNGRVLLADVTSKEVKTFGKVDGKILSILCHPIGNQLAIHYASKNAQGLTVPCFALAASYIKKSLSDKKSRLQRTGSWRAGLQVEWTDFIMHVCTQGVKSIVFDADACVTANSQNLREKWVLQQAETDPILVKLEE